MAKLIIDLIDKVIGYISVSFKGQMYPISLYFKKAARALVLVVTGVFILIAGFTWWLISLFFYFSSFISKDLSAFFTGSVAVLIGGLFILTSTRALKFSRFH